MIALSKLVGVESMDVGLPLDMETPPEVVLRIASDEQDWESVHELFLEYAQGLSVDLAFQDFDTELASLPERYAQPAGCVVLAFVDGMLAGCCAMRGLESPDYPDASEMKRLYVRRLFRGFGLGRLLAQAVMEQAALAGYGCILLDTLDEMDAARALYEDLGFEEIEPYYYNPHPQAFFLKASLV